MRKSDTEAVVLAIEGDLMRHAAAIVFYTQRAYREGYLNHQGNAMESIAKARQHMDEFKRLLKGEHVE